MGDVILEKSANRNPALSDQHEPVPVWIIWSDEKLITCHKMGSARNFRDNRQEGSHPGLFNGPGSEDASDDAFVDKLLI